MIDLVEVGKVEKMAFSTGSTKLMRCAPWSVAWATPHRAKDRATSHKQNVIRHSSGIRTGEISSFKFWVYLHNGEIAV